MTSSFKVKFTSLPDLYRSYLIYVVTCRTDGVSINAELDVSHFSTCTFNQPRY